jgi:glycosyltransferase involved in cell wall biosynthesis
LLESLALGHAVVTTSRGVEPFAPLDREVFVVRDTDRALADAVVQLIQNTPLRTKFSEAGRSMVRARFAPSIKAGLIEEEFSRQLRSR